MAEAEIEEKANEAGSDQVEPTAPPADQTGPEEAVSNPEFPSLSKSGDVTGKAFELDRFQDVQVAVVAELGKVKIAIQELMKLSEGSVIELNRNINSPVELVAQGVPLGNGEVVVVDDSFAIRVKEVYASSK